MAINRIPRSGGFTRGDDARGQSSGQHPHGREQFSLGSDISDLARILSDLQQLLQKDPNKFQRVMSGIADGLESDAKAAEADKSQSLLQLAMRFREASRTGALSPIQHWDAPSGSGERHHLRGLQHYGVPQGAGDASDLEGPSSLDLRILEDALRRGGAF